MLRAEGLQLRDPWFGWRESDHDSLTLTLPQVLAISGVTSFHVVFLKSGERAVFLKNSPSIESRSILVSVNRGGATSWVVVDRVLPKFQCRSKIEPHPSPSGTQDAGPGRVPQFVQLVQVTVRV